MINFNVEPSDPETFEAFVQKQEGILNSNPALNVLFFYGVLRPTLINKAYNFKINLNFLPIYYVGHFLLFPAIFAAIYTKSLIWFICPLVFYSTYFFWTSMCYMMALRVGLHKFGYRGQLKMYNSIQKCPKLDISTLDTQKFGKHCKNQGNRSEK